MVIFGFGVINFVIGLVDVMFDSVLLLVIIGNVVQYLMGIDVFQEVDIIGIIMLIIKYNYVVCDVDELLCVIVEVICIVCLGCLGLVLVDIFKDVQFVVFVGDIFILYICLQVFEVSVESIVLVRELLRNVKKFVLVMGGGLFDVLVEFIVFVYVWGLLVIIMLMGLGVYLVFDFFWLGMLGMYGLVVVNCVIFECDVLFVVGMCFDDWVMGWVSGFVLYVQIIYVEFDVVEIGKIVWIYLLICSDVKIVVW